MLKTNVMNRGEGKTTKVIQLMNEDKEAILVIPLLHLKNYYPNNIKNRIETFDSILNNSLKNKNFSKVIIDEGFQANKEILAHLYYILGKNNIETIVYGTETNIEDTFDFEKRIKDFVKNNNTIFDIGDTAEYIIEYRNELLKLMR